MQPANQIAVAGDNLSLSVVATGTQPLSYQWRLNGTNLSAATASGLVFTNVQVPDSGTYAVFLSNSVGTLLSSNAILTVNPPPPCAAPPLGLVSWWRAEANALDEVGGHNGTLHNGAGFDRGRAGEAFSFNGTNSYVEVPDSASLRLTNELTIEFWVKRQTLNVPNADYIIEKGGDWTGGDQNYAVALHRSAYNYCLHFACAGAWWGAGSVADLNWHHCAVIARNGQAAPDFYIDGVQQTVTYHEGAASISLPSSTRPLHLGALLDPVTGWYYFSRTLVDEVSLYNRALTAVEVQAIYTAERSGKCVVPTPPTILLQPSNHLAIAGDNIAFGVIAAGTQPLSYQWRFNGTNLSDATATGLAFTNVQVSDSGTYSVFLSNSVGTLLSSNAVLTVNPPPPCAAPSAGLVGWWRGEGDALDQTGANNGALVGNATYGTGRVGQGFVLDGSGDGVQVGSAASLQLQDFTIEAWIKRSNSSLASHGGEGAGHIFGGSYGGYVLGLWDDGRLSLGKIGFSGVQSSRVITDTNSFHHVAVTKSGSTVVFYVDGVGETAAAYDPGFVFGGGFVIGARGGDYGASFLGSLDEVSFYNRPLAVVEVQAIYAAERSGKCVAPDSAHHPSAAHQSSGRCQEQRRVQCAGRRHIAARLTSGGSTGASCRGRPMTTLALTAVSASQAGSYDVVITNTVGAATSAVAVLTVYVPPPPVFTLQPESQTVPAGANVTLTTLATDTWPITYQWYFGGAELPGATSTNLSLTNVQAGNDGDYTVVAANAWNAATSTVATLTVVPMAPILTLQPQSAGVFAGFPAQLTVAATGTEPLSYQWQFYGTNLPGATSTSYVVSNMLPADAGPYRVIVSNPVGDTPSAEASLALSPVVAWGATPIGLMALPIEVTNAVAVAAGAQHNLALRRDGTIVAWGAADQTNIPTGLASVVAIAAGSDHSVALKADGTVVAWGGANTVGQTNVPANLSNVVAVAAGASHSLALRDNGTVAAWGLNSSGQSTVPGTLTNVVAISAGSNHSIALRADGKVFAWGNNAYGQTAVPSNLVDVVAIAAGAIHNLALRSDGTVAAWGASTYGRTNVPAGLSNVIAIAAGGFHSLAVKSDGTPGGMGRRHE